MYDNGVKAIFTAAGGVGVGAINEAKARAKSGDEAWIIGVDVDQSEDGIYEENKSIILTSAMKKIDSAIFDIIKNELDGNFPGGQTLTFDIKNDGVGLPNENPNLSEDTMKTVEEVINDLEFVIGLNPTHISIYSLIIEANTKIYIDGVNSIDEDIDSNMY